MSPEEPVNVITDALSAPKEADLGASTPVPQTKPTESEIREARARHWTVRHATVIKCGHKLDVRHFPTRVNCEDCWEVFFELNPEGVAASHDVLLKYGTKPLIGMHGKKFVKMLGKHIQKQLLKNYAAPEVQVEASIEGGQLEVLDVKEEASFGIR